MRTEVLPADPASIARAAKVLRGGGLVAFPTETVYGLGANALDAAAVNRIFAAKGRPATNPVIVHIAAAVQVLQVATEWPAIASRLMEHFWPGPLTLILPKSPELPDIVTSGGPTVGVRMPAHAVVWELVRKAGVPVAAPSANRSGELSPTSADHVLRSLDSRIDLILDAGPSPGGIESTVLDVTTRPPRVLRPGLLSVEAIEAVTGPVQRAGPAAPDKPLASPGMLPRHYAPRTPLTCVEGDAGPPAAEIARAGRRIGWLTFGPVPGDLPPGVVARCLAPNPVRAAAELYATLHELDDAHLDRIVVTLPPDTAAWLAIRDRLRRASS
jgi:L-threonylcarbamoyladenylate synthase